MQMWVRLRGRPGMMSCCSELVRRLFDTKRKRNLRYWPNMSGDLDALVVRLEKHSSMKSLDARDHGDHYAIQTIWTNEHVKTIVNIEEYGHNLYRLDIETRRNDQPR